MIGRISCSLSNPMTTFLLYILAGLVLLYFGGEGLVRGASSLALRLGLTPLVVGLTVVAFGTSAPELVVSVKAAMADQGAIAIGNVIGSNTLNIGLILGLTALIAPLKVQNQILRLDAPIMIAVTLLAWWILSDLQVGRLEGAILCTGLLGYVVFTVLYARKMKPSAEVVAEYAEAVHTTGGSVAKDILFVLGGLALLVGGARFMVDGSVGLARIFGVSEAIIGLTIVALGTSLPELVTSLVAAAKNEPDIALGNIIGSNIFNILGILGAAALLKPMVGTGIQMTDIYVCIAFALLLLPVMRTGHRLTRGEGTLLLVGYLAYVLWIWPKE
jgi:cation:H+ antiporter